jgi:hypothetical protein
VDDPTPTSHTTGMHDDNSSECSSLNDNTHSIISKNANEPTTSGLICPVSLSEEQHFKTDLSICNFIENNEQTKCRTTTHKYNIESLLQ